MNKFIILQTVTPSYRNKFFDYLRGALKDDFQLYSGDCYFEKSVTSDLTYSKRNKITNFFFLNRMFLFQFGMWSIIFRKNILVLEMNPRIISNWIILIIRKTSKYMLMVSLEIVQQELAIGIISVQVRI